MKYQHYDHSHQESGLEEVLQYRKTPQSRLWTSLAITLLGMGVEIAGGLLTGSLALLSDAGHMFTHVFALGMSAVALRLGDSKPCHHRTFGLVRAEVLAAYTNALLIFAVTLVIVYEAVSRLLRPADVLTAEMLAVAAIGLVVNVLSILLLHGHGDNIGVRGALVHMMADTASSVAIVIGALVIAATGWRWIDPLLSIGIAGVIFVWAWGLFRDSARILLDIAPVGITTDDVELFVRKNCPRVQSVCNMRIWSVAEDVKAFTAEVVPIADATDRELQAIRTELAEGLQDRFGFREMTLQMADKRVHQAAGYQNTNKDKKERHRE
ncbi:MAG: cation diffusion facilitator family transporter [bacterium]